MTEDERVLIEMAHNNILLIGRDGFVWRTMKKHKEWNGYRECAPHLLGQNSHEYLRVCVRDSEGITRKAQAHRLVFLYFNGDISEGLSVNHKNGEKQDNRLENLELMISSQQMRHAIDVLGFVPNYSKNPAQHWKKRKDLKLTEEDYVNIKKAKEPVKFLAKQYGVTEARIYQIRLRR